MSNIELAKIIELGWRNKEALGLLVLAMAFTEAQRKAIKHRDRDRCQATVPHQHDTAHPLEVDHIIPQAYARKMGLEDSYIDSPENGLTKCRTAHDLKHPERVEIRHNYWKNKKIPGYDMGRELGNYAHNKLNKGEIYWNAENDRADHIRAIQLTQTAKKHGWIWPIHTKRGE